MEEKFYFKTLPLATANGNINFVSKDFELPDLPGISIHYEGFRVDSKNRSGIIPARISKSVQALFPLTEQAGFYHNEFSRKIRSGETYGGSGKGVWIRVSFYDFSPAGLDRRLDTIEGLFGTIIPHRDDSTHTTIRHFTHGNRAELSNCDIDDIVMYANKDMLITNPSETVRQLIMSENLSGYCLAIKKR